LWGMGGQATREPTCFQAKKGFKDEGRRIDFSRKVSSMRYWAGLFRAWQRGGAGSPACIDKWALKSKIVQPDGFKTWAMAGALVTQHCKPTKLQRFFRKKTEERDERCCSSTFQIRGPSGFKGQRSWPQKENPTVRDALWFSSRT